MHSTLFGSLSPIAVAAVDQAILSKIRKSLNLAQHEATGEAEAKNALK